MQRSILHQMRLALKNAEAIYCKKSGGIENVIPFPQIEVLEALKVNGPLSQIGIVRATGVDRSTLSMMLRTMLENGTIARVRSEEDRRASFVSITPRGLEAHRLGMKALSKTDAAILSRIPIGENLLFRGLTAIIDMEVK